jgi:hypothetical protein
VTAAEAVVTAFGREGGLNAVSNLFAVDEFASDAEMVDPRERLQDACRGLQAVADRRGIAVDLSCSP